MLLFPNCKINLGLNIIARRPDGYHDLETIFFPIALRDALEIIQQEPAQQNQELAFQSTGLAIAGESNQNLCIKAYGLLKQHFPIQMHLHKVIPMGAGLGGGSADGAFTLLLLNQYFRLGLSQEQLLYYALQLGSDCPFFIINKPCFAEGRGEILTEISIDLADMQCVLINPGIHIATAWAFAQLKPARPSLAVKDIVQQPISNWKSLLVNDFELPVIQHFPEIGQIKQQLYLDGAVYASLTGSGSTVFGFFPKNTRIDFTPYQNYRVYLI